MQIDRLDKVLNGRCRAVMGWHTYFENAFDLFWLSLLRSKAYSLRTKTRSFNAETRLCLAGNRYVLENKTYPAIMDPTGCYIFTLDFPMPDLSVEDANSPHTCTILDYNNTGPFSIGCLFGFLYSTDINQNGPFVYDLRPVCGFPKTHGNTETPDYEFKAETDPKNPDYNPTSSFEQTRIQSVDNSHCWTSKRPLSFGLTT